MQEDFFTRVDKMSDKRPIFLDLNDIKKILGYPHGSGCVHIQPGHTHGSDCVHIRPGHPHGSECVHIRPGHPHGSGCVHIRPGPLALNSLRHVARTDSTRAAQRRKQNDPVVILDTPPPREVS